MTVKRPTLVGATVDELIQFIEDRQLAAGDTLPPTAELAEQLDVSRTVVREAIAELAGQGLLSRRQGKDTTITFPGGRELERILRLRSALGFRAEPGLSQWRSILLAGAAGYAAREATLDDATSIATYVRDLANASSVDASVSTEENLHLAIAEISRNDITTLSLEGTLTLVRPTRMKVWTDIRRNPERMALVDQALGALVNAVQTRDSEGATRAMNEYLAATSASFNETVASYH